MSIQQQVAQVETIIRQVRPTAGSPPLAPVTLVAVTKYATVEQMQTAYAAGIRHFGENKVQDALDKMASFPATDYPDLRWHLIGHLQGNKVKKALGRFSLIHSVDSLPLAEAISNLSTQQGFLQPVLLQVNISQDASRHGFSPDELLDKAAQIARLPGLELRGLMTMAPAEASLTQNDAALKAAFSQVATLKSELESRLGIDLPELSMGMSHDFPQALACGATIIRIGNYLFKT
ncbi:YggS family pyridoxal phosphate-dependent enzyme [Vampirovibrio chlorellavorus]|uniref:YggS family pyridoxal phosphate-dependent enzyme n=1 Tax=Vampirovibrio chlorellavorus TaxID=758823 RepID=UPI0026EF2484|nr:YggS family pyridoxal phosphate-dependent enzyme [Vampirovibrio chlorellavorus]